MWSCFDLVWIQVTIWTILGWEKKKNCKWLVWIQCKAEEGEIHYYSFFQDRIFPMSFNAHDSYTTLASSEIIKEENFVCFWNHCDGSFEILVENNNRFLSSGESWRINRKTIGSQDRSTLMDMILSLIPWDCSRCLVNSIRMTKPAPRSFFFICYCKQLPVADCRSAWLLNRLCLGYLF